MQPAVQEAVVFPPGYDEFLDQLAEARQRWGRREFVDYSFRVEQVCYCKPRSIAATVKVVADSVVSVTDFVGDGQPMAPLSSGVFFTIDELFDMIVRADPVYVQAWFDPDLGNPTHVVIGNIAVDAGWMYDLYELVPHEK